MKTRLVALLVLLAGFDARASDLAVLPPRAPAELATVASGATEWVRARFGEAGLTSSDSFAMADALPRDRANALPSATSLRELGAQIGADRAWVLDLDADRGKAVVQLVLVDLTSGSMAAAGRAETTVAKIGSAVADVADAVIAQSGATGRTLDPPSLAELDRYGRAVAALNAGRLVDGWRALGNKTTATSQALRARFEAAGLSDGLPLGERARLAVTRGDTERARLWLRAQAGEHKDDPLLALASAESAEELGDAERAIPLFDRAIELDPNSQAARAGRARALFAAGRSDEAMLAVAELQQPDTTLLETAVELPSLDTSARAKLHFQLGDELGVRFESEAAVQNFGQAAQLDTNLAGASERNTAVLYTQLGEPAQALAPAQRALDLGAADATLYEALGAARRGTGDTAGAREAFEQARAMAPGAPGPLMGLGEMAMESGDSAAASQLLSQALQIAPAHTHTRIALAGLMRATGQVDGALAVLEGHPAGPNAELLRETASIRAAQGDLIGAEGMLEQAMELAPANITLTQELAKLRETSGDTAGAESLRKMAERMGGGPSATASELAGATPSEADSSTLNELAATFPQRVTGREAPVQVVALLPPSIEPTAGWLPAFLRPKRIAEGAIGEEITRALGTRFEVVGPSEIPRELAPAEQESLRAFEDGDATVAQMNDALGTDAVFVARVRTSGPDKRPGALHVEVRMLVGNDPMSVRRFGNQTWLAGGEAQFSEWNPSALVAYSFVLLLCLLPLLRGWGELTVGIQYASLGKGFFSIKLSRRPQKAEAGQAQKRGTNRYLTKMRLMGRYERSMVGRETLFKWLPARRYYVTVHGLLQDPTTDEVVGNYAAEQTVVVKRGVPARLDFDFRAKECAVEVCVFAGSEPVAQAVVAVRGQPQSLRYARTGRTLLYLAPDRYKILVGWEDRVLERELLIDSFAPRTLSVDAGDVEAQLFTGCVEAVEPYLLGNLDAAAEALERVGDDVAAARLRGEHFAAIGDTEKAAHAFQRAGRFEQAATLLSDGGADASGAAALYEKAGNHEKAAEAYRATGDFARAAHHYEIVYRYEDAVECYREAGNAEKVCELLEKLAHNFEAARCAMDLGDADRAIRCLQMIELRDREYVNACRLLGEIFTERGELDLAVQKLDEAVTVGGGENAPLEVVEQLARTLEQAGRLDKATEAWESIRARDFHYPEAAVKIDALRHMAEAERATRATLTAPGQPAAETRYEILGEIGRGGMGVVMRARDKRLGRVVALKRLPDNLRNHPTAVRLFLREARAAAALNHRNIVTLFDAGQEEDQYFLTMELLEGHPLQDVLNKKGKLSPRDAARLGVQAAAGLEYAHAQGVVHRDIKTSNLFFTKDRVLKIMDFGLAKMTEEVRRAATVVGGTPYYMAPEQAAGEDVDHRADQYALGVTLFELVTGDVPFKTGDVTYHHRHTPAPDPRSVATDLPEDFADVIARLMAKRPEDRFPSTGEAGAQLARIAKRLAV